jgi:hypothetical protein
MSQVDKVSEQIQKLPLSDLLRMTASAIDTNLDEKRLDFILIHLETALQMRRLMKTYGIKDDSKD